MKSFSFHTRLSGPGTSHENTSCNIVFRSLLHENYMKFSQNFQVGGAHTPGGSLRGFLPSLLDRRSASRRGCRGICSGRLMGMCLRCARCSTVSLKTLPEKAPRRFHFRSKFQVKTFQVEIFARTLVHTYWVGGSWCAGRVCTRAAMAASGAAAGLRGAGGLMA